MYDKEYSGWVLWWQDRIILDNALLFLKKVYVTKDNKNELFAHNLDLDVGEAWTLDSDDELSCYGDEIASSIAVNDGAVSTSTNDLVTLQVDRKSSTGSQVKNFGLLLESYHFYVFPVLSPP